MLDLFVVAVSFLVILLFYWWFQKPGQLPPGPRGFPLFGILPYLSSFPERDFGAWRKKYGPIMTVQMGWKTCVVLNDYDIVIETLVKRSEEFAERPYVRFLDMLTHNGIVMTTGGPVWRSHRRYGVSALRKFGGNKGVMERKVNEEAVELVQQLKEMEGKPFKIQNTLANAVANVICNIALGRRYDYNDSQFQMLITNLLGNFRGLSDWKTNVLIFVPFLCDVPPFTKHVEENLAMIKPIRAMIGDLIKERKSTFDPNDIRDILDGYLESFVHKEDNFVFANCQDFFYDLFIAGAEPTSITLTWGLLCLMLHQDVQEKMLNEIDNVIGREGTPSVAHRDKMPFTCAVIHEVMRYRTVVPLSLPQCATKDVTVRGYRIPKGTQIITNLWQVHNDDTYWKNPSKFDPQRHLDDSGNFTNSRNVIPFSAGSRGCLGEQLARIEVWLFLVTIIQRFRISCDPNDPDPPSLDCGTNALLYIPTAYEMVIKSR